MSELTAAGRRLWDPRATLATLRSDEERGDWQGAAWLLKRNGTHLDEVADAEMAAELASFRRRLRAALDYERLHGEGALLRKGRIGNATAETDAELAKMDPRMVEALARLWTADPPDAERALWGET